MYLKNSDRLREIIKLDRFGLNWKLFHSTKMCQEPILCIINVTAFFLMSNTIKDSDIYSTKRNNQRETTVLHKGRLCMLVFSYSSKKYGLVCSSHESP